MPSFVQKCEIHVGITIQTSVVCEFLVHKVIRAHPETTGDPRHAPKRVRTPCACNLGPPLLSRAFCFWSPGGRKVCKIMVPRKKVSLTKPLMLFPIEKQKRLFEKKWIDDKIAGRSCCFGLFSNLVFLVFSVSRGKCELLS